MWTEEPLAILKNMHAAKFSASRIVKALDDLGYKFTRSAVVGMARRLGLKNGRTPGNAWRFDRKLAAASTVVVVAKPKKPKPPNYGKPVAVEVQPARSGDLRDLEHDQCRYPLGAFWERPPFKFCTNDAKVYSDGRRSAYCVHHHRLCYTPR